MPSIFRNNGNEHNDPQKIAESFNLYFSRVGKELKEQIPPCDSDPINYLPSDIGNHLVSFCNTNEAEVEEIINNTKNVGGGMDGINSRIFKATFRVVLKQLVFLMNLCLQQSVFPSALKRAVIKPIYKTGDKQFY